VLDDSSFPKLRELVRESKGPDTFHFGAAAAPAHHGDGEIVADLEARRPAFREKHMNLEGSLVRHLWQIQMQHPASRLLEYVATGAAADPNAGLARVAWALRRAGQSGLPKDEIRATLLKYAAAVKPTGPLGIRYGLVSAKTVGLELGVLKPDDLADVKLPKGETH
jgi:hypothetical protein